MKKLIEKFSLFFIPGIIAGLLIILFLTGKIIDYPRGTLQGGIIGGIGVLLIIVSAIAINYLIFKLKKYFRM